MTGMGTVLRREEAEGVVDLPRNSSPVGSQEVCFSAVRQSSLVVVETMDLRRKSSAAELELADHLAGSSATRRQIAVAVHLLPVEGASSLCAR